MNYKKPNKHSRAYYISQSYRNRAVAKINKPNTYALDGVKATKITLDFNNTSTKDKKEWLLAFKSVINSSWYKELVNRLIIERNCKCCVCENTFDNLKSYINNFKLNNSGIKDEDILLACNSCYEILVKI